MKKLNLICYYTKVVINMILKTQTMNIRKNYDYCKVIKKYEKVLKKKKKKKNVNNK